jgi:hypothetical protein
MKNPERKIGQSDSDKGKTLKPSRAHSQLFGPTDPKALREFSCSVEALA